MPYKTVSDLPDSVRDHLPKHAQEIFRAAFNNAEREYGEEERAFRGAWAAVKDNGWGSRTNPPLENADPAHIPDGGARHVLSSESPI